MFTFKAVLAAVLTTALSAYATVLELELPSDFPAAMVTAPAEGDDAKLNDFVAAELKKMPEPNGDFVIFFTKNGEKLFRNPATGVAAFDTPPQFGSINFTRGNGWDNAQWLDAYWHLFDVGGNGVYGLAAGRFFGLPFVYTLGGHRDVTVALDIRFPDMGVYYISTDTIVLRRWRKDDLNQVYKDTDRGMLTRCMLHAFRGPWPAPWDHFDCGTVHAAWRCIQQEIAAEEPGFNDLGHDEQLPFETEYQRPEYMSLSYYNAPEFAT